MNVLSAILVSSYDILVLYIQISIIYLLSSEKPIKSKLVVAYLISAILKFTFDYCFVLLPVFWSVLLMVINEIKSCFLIWYIKGKCSISDAWIAIIIQEFCNVICSVTFTSDYIQISKNQHTDSIVRIVIVGIIAILFVLLNRNNKIHNIVTENIFEIIPHRVFAFIFLSLFLEGGIIQLIGSNKLDIPESVSLVKTLFFILTIINAVIVVTLITSVVYQKYYGRLNRLLEQQVNSQLNHYKKLEELNSEIREFRHDFNNHIKCLESMLTTKNYADAQKYLGKITSMMPSGEFLFRTGNYVADAILTETQENNKNVQIEFNGLIPQNIDNADLCVVLSNAMSNASEACSELNGTNTITVYGNLQQGVFILIVKNPTANNGYSDTFLKTSKPDKQSHGFGLTNIRRVVKKYDGTMNVLLKDGIFTLSLTMSIEQPVFTS